MTTNNLKAVLRVEGLSFSKEEHLRRRNCRKQKQEDVQLRVMQFPTSLHVIRLNKPLVANIANKLTLQSRVLLEKLKVKHLTKQFPVYKQSED